MDIICTIGKFIAFGIFAAVAIIFIDFIHIALTGKSKIDIL